MNVSIIHLTQESKMSEGNTPGPDTTPHLMIWGERKHMTYVRNAILSCSIVLGRPKYIGKMFSYALPYREPGQFFLSRKRNSMVIFDKELLMRLVPDDVEDKELELLADVMGMEDVVKRFTGMNSGMAESLCELYSNVAQWFMALLNGDDEIPKEEGNGDED
jgi:hypothetical protein